jgi:hypothetical protein
MHGHGWNCILRTGCQCNRRHSDSGVPLLAQNTMQHLSDSLLPITEQSIRKRLATQKNWPNHSSPAGCQKNTPVVVSPAFTENRPGDLGQGHQDDRQAQIQGTYLFSLVYANIKNGWTDRNVPILFWRRNKIEITTSISSFYIVFIVSEVQFGNFSLK